MKILMVDGTNVVMRYAAAMVPGFAKLPHDHTVIRALAEGVMKGSEKAIRDCAVKAAGCQHVIVALDSVDSWRKDVYPEYKGNRTVSTNAWTNQLHAHLLDVGIYCIRVPTFEGDDVIATLVARSARAGHHSAVLSGDSDMLMLASLWCDVYQFGRKQEPRFVKRSLEWIADRYGLQHAGQLAAYKAIVGEPGENLPGIEGIGPVKARKLLGYNSTPAITALADGQAAQFATMLQLVTLREDVPIGPIQPSECRITSSLTGAA